jgi:hypothetical protein
MQSKTSIKKREYRRYALAVLVLRKDEPEWQTKLFLNSFVKDVDQLVRENNS